MQAVQGWFQGGPSQSDAPKSVLAEWNSYAASGGASSSRGTNADLEAGEGDSFLTSNPMLKQANATFLSAFNVVSKTARDLPTNLQQSAQNVPSRQSIMYFGVTMAAGVFFLSLAFTVFLPVMVLAPQKFAICFTLGCLFVLGSFFVLKGTRNQFQHMLSMERLPFTAVFAGSMLGTIYVSMVLHSYLLSVLFSGVQVMSLLYYVVSYFPGGAAGMKFLPGMATSTCLRCFGR